MQALLHTIYTCNSHIVFPMSLSVSSPIFLRLKKVQRLIPTHNWTRMLCSYTWPCWWPPLSADGSSRNLHFLDSLEGQKENEWKPHWGPSWYSRFNVNGHCFSANKAPAEGMGGAGAEPQWPPQRPSGSQAMLTSALPCSLTSSYFVQCISLLSRLEGKKKPTRRKESWLLAILPLPL